MNKKFIFSVIILLFLFLNLSGCYDRGGVALLGSNSILVGTWVTDSPYDTLTLNANGKCKKFIYDGTWEIEDNKLTIIYEMRSRPIEKIFYYSFSNDNTTLTLTTLDTGYTLIYNKK
jgi:hypothetical protein